MRFLIVGDIVGRPGRRCLRKFLPRLREELEPDVLIANVENSAGGFGLTERVYRELKELGVDVMTSGNHIWDKKEVFRFINEREDLLRPANYPQGVPGRGWNIFKKNGTKFAVINLMGRIYLDPNLDNPFRVFDSIHSEVSEQTDIVIVDFHAETTSEKWAFGLYADGKASVVYGTHTHVPTADETILPKGTAYITDVGMTGAVYSVIGMKSREPIERFTLGLPRRFEVEDKGEMAMNAILVEVDERGRATHIERVRRTLSP